MFALFKSNNPGVVAGYFLFLILFRVVLFFVPAAVEPSATVSEPLGQLLVNLLAMTGEQQIWWSSTLAAVLTFMQSLMINSIINEHKMTAKKTYLGGLVFIFFVSFLTEGLLLTPVLAALSLTLLCVQSLFNLVKKEKALGEVFDLGFLISAAALFYLPSVVLLLFAYAGLGTIRPFSVREWIIILLGFLSPLLLTFTFYYVSDTPFVWHALAYDPGGFTLNQAEWYQLGALLIVTLCVFIMVPALIFSALIQVRKLTTLLIFFTALTICGFFIPGGLQKAHWTWLALPLSVLLTMLLMQIKRHPVARSIFFLLILLIIASQILTILYTS